MREDVRYCDCLQGRAAPQARPGPLGRRVSQVGTDSSLPIGCMANYHSVALRREGMREDVRYCDCLQGRAAPQARPGPLGRRVSQVGLDSSLPLRLIS